MARTPEKPRQDKDFKKVVERMLKTPPKPHKPVAPKPARKKKAPAK